MINSDYPPWDIANSKFKSEHRSSRVFFFGTPVYPGFHFQLFGVGDVNYDYLDNDMIDDTIAFQGRYLF